MRKSEKQQNKEIDLAIQSVRLRKALFEAIEAAGRETDMIVDAVLDALAMRVPTTLHKLNYEQPHGEHAVNSSDCPKCDDLREFFS